MHPIGELPGINQISPSRQYVCGHCGSPLASNRGLVAAEANDLRICHFCNRPTWFGPEGQVPGPPMGDVVGNLPADIEAIYREARLAAQAAAPTASVLVLRKLLMHLAVGHGAAEGESFVAYIDHLAAAGWVPPNGRPWVDRIRQQGNQATHEITLMSAADALLLLKFTGMLLKFMYEFPGDLSIPVE